jgi:hypothetical protein
MAQQRTSVKTQTLGEPNSLPECRVLRYSALIFLAGLLVHGADHWRRGFDAVTPQVYWAGTGLSILGLIAIALVLMGHRLAPMFAVAVGFPTALGVAASHLLPRWSSLSDAFPGSGVGALSYAAVIVEIVGALALGMAGTYTLRRIRQSGRGG